MIKAFSKTVKVFLVIGLLTLGLLGCQNNQTDGTDLENNSSFTASNEVKEVKKQKEQKYEVVIDNFNKVTIYKKVPERIVTLSIGELEICLALELENKIAGIVIAEGYAKDYDKNIRKLPVLADGYGSACIPTLETIIDAEPDFVYGTAFAFNADYGIAAQKDFDELGINTYVTKGTYDEVVTMDDVYEDIMNIGKIFNKEEKAKEIINDLKEDIVKYEVKNSDPIKVFVYDSGVEKPSTAGKNALITSLIEIVGGKNIFDNIASQFTEVNWETLAEANPEVIVISDYEGMTVEEKINTLKSHPAMADVKAVQNENFIVVPLDYSFPGMKNTEAIKMLSEGMPKK